MALEIEAKLRIRDTREIDNVRERLRSCKAIPLTCGIEHDTFFDLPDHSIARQGKAVRLRVMMDEHGKLMQSVLTYKGPQQAAQYKTREEIELQLHRQVQPAEQILERLGLRKVIQYQKRREAWRLDTCCITLDQLPRLGCFIEIEGPDEETITRMIDTLHLSSAPRESRTYLEMILESIAAGGAEEMVFSKQTY